MSITDGTQAIINENLFGASPFQYKWEKALKQLAKEDLAGVNGAALVRALYEKVMANWREANKVSPRQPSKENWRFTLNSEISRNNLSIETQVERAIVRLAEEGDPVHNDWANQVPVASGLLNSVSDKRSCVDLVQRIQPRCFDFIELKMKDGSGHAVFAAFEILLYGLVYLFSRRHASELGYLLDTHGLLGAQEVRLVVLAPADYYQNVSSSVLIGLSKALNTGLVKLCDNECFDDLLMRFDFQQFGDAFTWRSSNAQLLETTCQRHSVLPE